MLALAGPLAVASAVVVVGGVYKLRDPRSALGAFRTLGLPDRPWAVRSLGLVEVLVGLCAFLVGGRLLAAAVALLYAGFAVVAVLLVRASSSGTSCGCFGSQSSEVTPVHVVADGALALVAATAALTSAPGFVTAHSDLAAAGVPYLLLVALGTWLVVTVLTALPDSLVAARRTPSARTVTTFAVRASVDVGGAER